MQNDIKKYIKLIESIEEKEPHESNEELLEFNIFKSIKNKYQSLQQELSDVYGLTDILNNLRVETLTEVVSLADTEVIVTLVNITVGSTPQVFVDGIPITNFTVDNDSQITLDAAHSSRAKTVTVVQNNVRYD